MANKRIPKGPPPQPRGAETMVEVPSACVLDASTMSWEELVTYAPSVGWRVRHDTSEFRWCAPGHALLRQGRDEMKGIPVLLYDNA